MKTFFCKHCGAELDEHDVENNIASWGLFRVVCSDDECVKYEDTKFLMGEVNYNG